MFLSLSLSFYLTKYCFYSYANLSFILALLPSPPLSLSLSLSLFFFFFFFFFFFLMASLQTSIIHKVPYVYIRWCPVILAQFENTKVKSKIIRIGSARPLETSGNPCYSYVSRHGKQQFRKKMWSLVMKNGLL